MIVDGVLTACSNDCMFLGVHSIRCPTTTKYGGFPEQGDMAGTRYSMLLFPILKDCTVHTTVEYTVRWRGVSDSS